MWNWSSGAAMNWITGEVETQIIERFSALKKKKEK